MGSVNPSSLGEGKVLSFVLVREIEILSLSNKFLPRLRLREREPLTSFAENDKISLPERFWAALADLLESLTFRVRIVQSIFTLRALAVNTQQQFLLASAFSLRSPYTTIQRSVLDGLCDVRGFDRF